MEIQENLGQYVRRVVLEKRLKLSEIEKRADGKISDSYVCSILAGKSGSLTVEKLRALAFGLGVCEDELFAVARGQSLESGERFRVSEFAAMYDLYMRLPDADKRELRSFIDILKREIERRTSHEPDLSTIQHVEEMMVVA